MAEHIQATQPATRPCLNTFDMPELMDGAQPGATNVQREAFEVRCKQVWQDEQEYEEEQRLETGFRRHVQVESQLDSYLEMFPTIDPSLVRTLYHESGADMCLTQLLALSESADESAASHVPKLDPKIEIGNRELFPSLTDADGWEIINPVAMKDEEKETHQWRDCCELAKDFPTAELRKPKVPASPVRDDRGKKKTNAEVEEDDGDDGVLDEVDLRRKCGERRAARKGWGRKPVSGSTAVDPGDEEGGGT